MILLHVMKVYSNFLIHYLLVMKTCINLLLTKACIIETTENTLKLYSGDKYTYYR